MQRGKNKNNITKDRRGSKNFKDWQKLRALKGSKLCLITVVRVISHRTVSDGSTYRSPRYFDNIVFLTRFTTATNRQTD